jgi:transposase
MPTKVDFCPKGPNCQIDDVKNALPWFDGDSDLLHQNQGRAMCGKAAKVELTTRMHDILVQLSSSRNIGKAVAARATIILMAFEKANNQTIANRLGFCRKMVGMWRRRWRDSFAALLEMQFTETSARFRRAVIECLCDAPRSGSPGTFTPNQIVDLIGLACEPPENSDRPVTSWTGSELADELQKRGVVDSISPSHVNRILREVDLQPHRDRYWCNTTEKDPELFRRQVELVCQTYLEAPTLYDQFDTHTVCVDEMTSLQANERRAATKLPKPGQVAKQEFQYTRHGTVCVTANWHVVRGQVFATTISETRDNQDFARHIEQTIASDPMAGWVFVVDNLNTHCGEPLVRMVADQLGIDPATLGTAKKEGVLATMATRRAFLSEPSHRIRFVYLPKHSSWLNQIEIIFGIINRRVMRRGSFTSRFDLVEKLRRFLEYFNATFARPMNWTYTGRPTRSTPSNRPKTWRELRQTEKPWKKLALVGTNL